MAATQFFRGPSRIDWLFALMLQTACDWGTTQEVQAVAGILGFESMYRRSFAGNVAPTVTVVYTTDFLFVVLGSTRGEIQWVGNVLGSVAVAVPPSHGTVSAYFGSVAYLQLSAIAGDVVANVGNRKLVLVGFSLGGASATIMKDMFLRAYAIPSACLAFGPPRPGTTSFAADYPAENLQGIGVVNDPVPSVPPVEWTGIGLRNNWTPLPPFVTYTHPTTGFRLFLDGQIQPEYDTQSVSEVILGFDTGVFLQFHNQPLYARLLRMGLPETLDDGYEGYASASLIDDVAATVFSFGSVPWRWGSHPSLFLGGSSMAVQLAIYVRNKTGPTLGFQEVYYFTGDDPKVPFDAALGGSTNYVLGRRQFLSSDCEIYAVRCSHVGSPKKSFLRKFAIPQPGTKGPMDVIDDAIGLTAYTEDHRVKRQFHFRGIDQTWFQADKLTAAGIAGYNSIFSSSSGFLNVMISGGLGLLAGTDFTGVLATITAAAKATQNDPITLTFSAAVVIPPNTLIEIRGCKGAPLLNGRWLTVGTYAAGTCILSGSARYSAPASISGSVKLVTPTIYPMFVAEFSGVGTKKTGRPSFLQRGRQSAQLRHR